VRHPLNFPEDSHSKEDIMSARVPSDTVRQFSSKYHGVYWKKQSQKWTAQILVKGKKIHLGYYDKAEDAALAYDKAVLLAIDEVREGEKDML
jgi:hypothetical protein